MASINHDMVVLIVSSTEDPASTNMKTSLLEQTPWEEFGVFYEATAYRHATMKDVVLVTIPDRKIRHENIDTEVHDQLHLNPRIAVFLSRHRSKMEEPTLTVHPIGNYGAAEFGGQPRALIPAAPRFMAHLLRLIKKHLQTTDMQYHVCYEVTHHGPYLNIPTLFAEVGSTEHQWREKKPAEIIAVSLLELLSSCHYEQDFPTTIPVLLGIGGGHYAPRFTDVVFERNASFGHMIPTYQIDAGAINDEMMEQAMKATPNLTGVYLHKKALKKSQITEYKQWFQARDVQVVSSNELPALE
jgi:D-aminoacyl-tRNA deacylase